MHQICSFLSSIWSKINNVMMRNKLSHLQKCLFLTDENVVGYPCFKCRPTLTLRKLIALVTNCTTIKPLFKKLICLTFNFFYFFFIAGRVEPKYITFWFGLRFSKFYILNFGSSSCFDSTPINLKVCDLLCFINYFFWNLSEMSMPYCEDDKISLP